MEAVDEFEAERNQQRDAQQHEGADREALLTRLANVTGDAERHKSKPRGERQQKGDGADVVWFFVQMWKRRRTTRQVSVDRCV